MDEKAAWGLAGALLGWLLSTGTAFVKEEIRIWRLSTGLREELRDVAAEIENVIETLKRNLNLIGASGMGATGILDIQHVFYQLAYKEVFPKLGQGTRLSYQRIHAALDSLNVQMQELDGIYLERSKLADGVDDPEIDRLTRNWQQRVQDGFVNACDIRWYIRRHLDGLALNPVEMYGEDHRLWLQHRAASEAAAKRHIVEGKGIKPESYSTTYDPERFTQAASRARSNTHDR